MRPALEGLCYLTDLACEGGDDVLGRELTRWAADVHAATLAVRAGKPEAAAQLRASALARVAQVSAVGQRLSVEQVYHASKLPPAVLLHEAMRALARGDALAAAAAVDEAQALLGGEVGACRCDTCGGEEDADGYCDRCACAASSACERLPDAAEEVEAAERSPLTPGAVVLVDDELGAWRVVDVSDTPCACCGGPSVDTLHRVTGRGALHHVCSARLHRTMPPSFCQICGVDTVPPAAYCPACDAVLASGGVE